MHTHPLKFALLSFLVITFTVIAGITYANAQVPGIPGLSLAFGGKVISTTNPAVACFNAEGGPIIIAPVRDTFPPGMYATTLATKRYSNIIVAPGTWIIGTYNPVPEIGTCFNAETAAPIPTFTIKKLGVSKALGF
jgi:hypothetical protein